MARQTLSRQLQRQQIFIDACPKIAPEDQGWNCNDQAKCSVVERDRYSVRQQRRISAGRGAARSLRAEDFDHADHRAKQPHQRRRGGNCGQGTEIPFEPVRDAAAAAFHRGAKVCFTAARVADQRTKAAGKNLAQRGILLELVHDVGCRDALTRDDQYFIKELRWGNLRGFQAGEAFDHEGQSQNGAGEQRPDWPPCGLYDGKQIDPRADEVPRDYGLHALLAEGWCDACQRSGIFRFDLEKGVDNFVKNSAPNRVHGLLAP